MNRYKSLGALLIAVMMLPSCGMTQMQVVSNIEETFEGIDEIVVNGGSLEVTYEGSDTEDEVFLSAYLESNRDHGIEIIYEVEGNRLRVELRRDDNGGWGNFRSKGLISLTGPEDMEMEISNSSGQMFVSNVSSDKIDLRISSGKIEAKTLSSDRINLTASSGKMEIDDIHGDLNCKISSGSANISNVEGDVSVEGSSGSYHISEVEGTVNGSLSSGSIVLDDIGELGSLTVSSGRIEATHAGLGDNTRFRGSSGSFTVQTDDDLEDYNFELSASSGGLEVGDTKTNKNLNINNGSDITVTGSTSSGRISIRN
jgi:lia operon protein LiaG